MKKVYINRIVIFLVLFWAISVNSQSPESTNITYITNTIEKPVYLEKLIIVTNTINNKSEIGARHQLKKPPNIVLIIFCLIVIFFGLLILFYGAFSAESEFDLYQLELQQLEKDKKSPPKPIIR